MEVDGEVHAVARYGESVSGSVADPRQRIAGLFAGGQSERRLGIVAGET